MHITTVRFYFHARGGEPGTWSISLYILEANAPKWKTIQEVFIVFFDYSQKSWYLLHDGNKILKFLTIVHFFTFTSVYSSTNFEILDDVNSAEHQYYTYKMFCIQLRFISLFISSPDVEIPSSKLFLLVCTYENMWILKYVL